MSQPGEMATSGEVAIGYYLLHGAARQPKKKLRWMSDFYIGRGWGAGAQFLPHRRRVSPEFQYLLFSTGYTSKSRKKLRYQFWHQKCFAWITRMPGFMEKYRKPEMETIQDIQSLDPLFMIESSFRMQFGFRFGKLFLSVTGGF